MKGVIYILNFEVVPLDTPPSLYAEIVLCFDYDFPMQEIEETLKLKAKEAKQWSETRINPITHVHNPGFWEYRTEDISSFDVDDLFDILHDLLASHMLEFQRVIQKYTPTDVILRIYVKLRQEGAFPAIRLDRHLLEAVLALNAYVDIVLDNDYVDTE